MSRPRVKLLTPFVGGKLPDYLPDFARRAGDVGIVDWELLQFDHVEALNQLMTDRLGTPCRKESGYAASDIRPMLADAFPGTVGGYEWWGWVETDVVLGDLDRLLPPLLDRHDAISMFPDAVSGPLMLFRNDSACNGLYRRGDWQWVLAEPSYCNYEETQGAHVAGFHKDGGMTRLLRWSGLRVHWDAGGSRWPEFPNGAPPYTCRLENGRLLETPGDGELMIYHFNHTKRWPL